MNLPKSQIAKITKARLMIIRKRKLKRIIRGDKTTPMPASTKTAHKNNDPTQKAFIVEIWYHT